MSTINNQQNSQSINQEVLFFQENNFNLWNINDLKKPINILTNYGLKDWSKYCLEDFNKLKVDLTKNIGFLSGYQYKSNQFIIVLDFDIFSKKKDDLKAFNTKFKTDKNSFSINKIENSNSNSIINKYKLSSSYMNIV